MKKHGFTSHEPGGGVLGQDNAVSWSLIEIFEVLVGIQKIDAVGRAVDPVKTLLVEKDRRLRRRVRQAEQIGVAHVLAIQQEIPRVTRSEERRVGKECRSR